MNLFSSLKIIAALTFSVASTPFAVAHNGTDHDHVDDPESATLIKADAAHVSADWLAKAKAEYPLDSCIVSEDKLEGSDMGTPQDYVYRREGKPDRLVRFCCNDCVKDFKKHPAKHLKMLDDAAVAKANAATSK